MHGGSERERLPDEASAQEGSYGKNNEDMQTIDIHAHFFPEAFLRLVAEEGGPHGVGCDWTEGGLPAIEIGD